MACLLVEPYLVRYLAIFFAAVQVAEMAMLCVGGRLSFEVTFGERLALFEDVVQRMLIVAALDPWEAKSSLGLLVAAGQLSWSQS